MINFSFIIPHKNTPELLQKCIDSIPRREDVQIIVVDDNSDAGKVDFEHFPGLDDPQVEVYLTKEGRGAGYARNFGLKHAVGKWLVFADADDYFTTDFTSFLCDYLNSSADIVVWKTCCINLDTGLPGNRGSIINEYTQEAIESGSFDNILLISTPVKGMYSSKMIFDNGIRFNECRWGNDVVFSSKVAISVKNAEASDCIAYCVSSHSSFGLKSNPSVESLSVRFKQESESIKLVRKAFRSSRNIHLWYFQTWFSLYKKNKVIGLRAIPSAIVADRFQFIKQCFIAFFS
mgnify:CR=1 FL=1